MKSEHVRGGQGAVLTVEERGELRLEEEAGGEVGPLEAARLHRGARRKPAWPHEGGRAADANISECTSKRVNARLPRTLLLLPLLWRPRRSKKEEEAKKKKKANASGQTAARSCCSS